MPRLRQVPRADADGLTTFMYDLVFGPGRDPVADPGTATGTTGDWWTVFALVPDVLAHAGQGFQLYRSPDRVLPPQLRELGMTRAGWARQSRFVFSQHCKSLRGVGMAEDKVLAVPHWQVFDGWSPVERAVLAYTDGLVYDGGRIAEPIVTALKEHLSDEQILELTYLTALYEMHAVMSRALRTEFDDVDDPITEVPGPEGFDPMSLFEAPARA